MSCSYDYVSLLNRHSCLVPKQKKKRKRMNEFTDNSMMLEDYFIMKDFLLIGINGKAPNFFSS